MGELTQFSPHLTGAVLNGTAGEHSDIYLQLFSESPKDVEIFLLNKNVDFEVSEGTHVRSGEPVETLSFLWQNEGIHLSLYDKDDLRRVPKNTADGKMLRADADIVRNLIEETQIDE
jgi:hypothetical protein